MEKWAKDLKTHEKCSTSLIIREMQINETRAHPYTMHENKLKMDERPKHKTRHHPSPGREHKQNIL